MIYKWNCHVSTHGSRRGSRHVPASRTFGWIFVSTHGSLAGADYVVSNLPAKNGVSTHGSLAGADLAGLRATVYVILFQLTAPLREPTIFDFDHSLDDSVSTHGSLAGADVILGLMGNGAL